MVSSEEWLVQTIILCIQEDQNLCVDGAKMGLKWIIKATFLVRILATFSFVTSAAPAKTAKK